MTATQLNDYSLPTLRRLAETRKPEEILAERDLVLRNYLITLRYHLLTHRMAARIRGDVSWVAFAAWASAQAGRYLRLEALPLARRDPFGVGAHVTEYVSLGNYVIFEEIAPLFDRFVNWLDGASDADHEAWVALVRGARHDEARALLTEALSLDPRPWNERTGSGQRLLLLAFEQYLFAMHEPDDDLRAERVFAANGAVGLHEQRRVDEVLRRLLAIEPLNRPLYKVMTPARRLRDASRPARARAARRLGPWIEARLGREATDALLARITVARLYTDYLMGDRASDVLGTLLLRLSLPLEELRLGADVPWMSRDAMFPEHLKTIDATDPELLALFAEVLSWDKTPNTTEGSAAVSWAKLKDRMNFLLDLFRTRQKDTSLLLDPVDVERRKRKKVGARRAR